MRFQTVQTVCKEPFRLNLVGLKIRFFCQQSEHGYDNAGLFLSPIHLKVKLVPALDQSSAEGLVGSSGTAPRSHWVI